MSLKSLIPNNDNLLSGGTSALNHDEHRGDTVVNDNEPPDEPQFVTVGQEKASRRRHARGRSRLDFDLAEALRLRALGWSDRRIARKMNNVSRATVRRRLMEYDARQQAQSPKPAPASEPASKPPQAPSMSAQAPKPPVVPVVAPPPEPKAAPVSKVGPVSVAPVALPEPDSNYDALVQYWAMRGLKNYKPDTRWFFLVHGRQNLQYATGLEQLAVSIDRWYEAYHDLEAFRDAERIWVVIDRRDDNREFVRSLVNDLWIRERCTISVGYESFERWIQTVMRDRMHRVWRNARPQEWGVYDSSQFETAHHFIPLPAPNCVREIEKLLEPPPEPEKPSPGGSWGEPYGFAKYGGFGSNSH